MTEIHACSACIFRHGYNDMQKLEKCCYETCEQFDADCKAHCKDCIQKAQGKCNNGNNNKCKINSSVEYINTTPLHFKICSLESILDKDALRCCFKKCENDYECQEKCIDAYNAMRPALVEDFNGQFKNPNKIVLFFILAMSFIIVRKIQFPENKWILLGWILIFYLAIYQIINSY